MSDNNSQGIHAPKTKLALELTHAQQHEYSINFLRKGLNIREACCYVGNISKSTMYRQMACGHLSGYVIGNRRYFLISELDEFLEKQGILSARGWS